MLGNAAGTRSSPNGAPAPVRAMLDEFAELFSDFWFGMMLLAVWGGMTLIGVVVDQWKPPDFYAANYAPALARQVLPATKEQHLPL